jgi:hypothetical protein
VSFGFASLLFFGAALASVLGGKPGIPFGLLEAKRV